MTRRNHNFAAWFAIVISITSLYLSYQKSDEAINISKNANDIAKQSLKESKTANKIASDSKNIALTKSSFEISEKSTYLTDQAYNDIYENSSRYNSLTKMMNGKQIEKSELISLIDIYENLGNKYCKGLIYSADIRSSFLTSLIPICNNSQVNKSLEGLKNGTALLCYKFVEKSDFAKTYKINTLSSCTFLD